MKATDLVPVMKTNQVFKFMVVALTAGAIFTGWSRSDDAANRVTTIRPEMEDKVLRAQMGPEGTIHLLLQGEDGPRYAKSLDNGRTFSAPISIVDVAARKPGLEFHGEDMALGKDGRVFVAMSNNAWKLKLPESEWASISRALRRARAGSLRRAI